MMEDSSDSMKEAAERTVWSEKQDSMSTHQSQKQSTQRPITSRKPRDLSLHPNQNNMKSRTEVGCDLEISYQPRSEPTDNATMTAKQPVTRPITEQQLMDEVKGIYAGLAMVEKKCVEIVSEQTLSTKRLTDQQWKALVALHRTLLQEHHDFFSATRNPTASEPLRGLAIRYAMPARMWRHGIHAFMELLRQRLPDSPEHMLSFVYLSYSMMALLKESVPSFVETWIECLGDLARYRMTIKDSDPRDREIWSNVARMWYTEAADKSPNIGRIQHHLAVLARPNIVEQLSYYDKALVSIIPFVKARESIMLFDMFLDNSNTAQDHKAWSGGAVGNQVTETKVIECVTVCMPLASTQQFAPRMGGLVQKANFLENFVHFTPQLISRIRRCMHQIGGRVVVLGMLASFLRPVHAENIGTVPSTAISNKGGETNPEFALLIAFWMLGLLVTTGIAVFAGKLPIKNQKATSCIISFTATLALTLRGKSVLSSIWYTLCTGISLGSSLWLGKLTLSPTNTLMTTLIRYIAPTAVLYAVFSGFEVQNHDNRLDLSAMLPCLSVFLAFGINAYVNEKMEELAFFFLALWERMLRCMGLERRRVFEMA